MSLASRKSGPAFHKPRSAKGASSNVTPTQLAILMVRAGFPPKPQVIAEGLATASGESGFNRTVEDYAHSGHIGLWQESSAYGSQADRKNPAKSTKAAYEHWKADGGFQQEWGQYDGNAYANWKQFEAEAIAGIRAAQSPDGGSSILGDLASGVESATGLPTGAVYDAAGNLISAGESTVGAIADAGDFLTEMAETLLDYKKLGQLAAEAMAWFLRLLLKAIWDYVAAPIWHWSERAVSWYWSNFFGAGAEKGSGGGKIGPILRQNAGVITIVFWSVGYAALWSDGTSLSPTDAHSSMLGQGVRAFDGTLARRNLIKPKDVKSKTPKKPKPKATSVKIDRTGEFSVKRKRAVSVAGSDGKTLDREGASNGRSNGGSARVPRPGEKAAPTGQTGGKETDQRQTVTAPPAEESQQTADQSRAGLDSRGNSSDRTKSTTSGSGKKRD